MNLLACSKHHVFENGASTYFSRSKFGHSSLSWVLVDTVLVQIIIIIGPLMYPSLV